jgi:hypothetical protein
MRKVLAFSVLLFFLGVLGLSSSEPAMRWLSHERYQDDGLLGSDKYRFGDLYGLSYLPAFRLYKDTTLIRNQALFDGNRDIDLTILGDSYLFSYVQMDTSNFVRAKKVTFRRWSDSNLEPLCVRPSGNKKVLLIETVERNAWMILNLDRLKPKLEQVTNDKPWYDSFNEFLFEHIYHPQLEQNLDFTLFNQQLFSPLKSLKAIINLEVFNRSSTDVAISENGEFLYMRETVDSTQRSSSFYPMTKDELHELGDRMLVMNQYAKSKGYDEVIFVIIPNPIVFTKTESKASNQFVPKLTTVLGDKVRLLDPTKPLMVGGKQYFFKSDSHWNQKGARAWLAQLNQQLLTL